MVKINGRWQCAAEYLDRCIGQQRVVDVIRRARTTCYIFENEHELPLLCFCCGEPLITEDLEQVRRDMRGRRLEGMMVSPVELEDGREIPGFELEFSKKGLFSDGRNVPLSPQVAARLRHPADCQRKKR